MNKKIVRLSDVMVDPVYEDKSFKQTGFDTSVRIIARNGRKDGDLVVKTYKNKTVLCGRTQLLEDVFPVTPNFAQHIFINDNVLGEYNTATGEDFTTGLTQAHNTPAAMLPRNNPALWRRRKVEYWCAGDGAINRTIPSQSHKSWFTNTKLYHMIPFRFIEKNQSLADELRRQYKMEVIFGTDSPYYGYKAYYFKKIDFVQPANQTTGINMLVDKQPYTPKWSDTVTDLENQAYDTSFKGNKVQQSYIDMTMNVASEEFKEWFEFTDKTLGNASISEIGLISGLNARIENGALTPIEDIPTNTAGYDTITRLSEVYDAELFAHLPFDPYPVSRDNSVIDFEYRVFV